MLKTKIQKLKKNLNRIPQEFFAETAEGKYKVIWFLNRQKPSVQASYDFDEERFGITIDGRIIYGFDSGCSCPTPWGAGDYGDTSYDVTEYKEFFLNKMPDFDAGWEEDASKRLDDLLLFFESDVDIKRLLTIENSEIRRAIMKRIGYDKVKECAEVVHIDEFGELLKIAGEQYVKVDDASTDRQYLLYVPDTVKTAKGAIAWTFYLDADTYNPEKES